MNKPPVNDTPSAWHEGELRLQGFVGAVERMEGIGKTQMARDFMPDQHREFYGQLPFVVLGSVDPNGDAWATLRAGQPGFMHSPEPRRLVLDLPREPADPADAGLEDGHGVGMLGIELHTRRRNRLNGNVRRSRATGFEIIPTQAYGNCPRYIHLRRYAFDDSAPGPVSESSTLEAADRAMIQAADSFYVASYVERDGVRQVDVSHRGGKPGFVHIGEDGTLTVPDFNGNLFFNTLGNMVVNPRAGLVFVDMRSGDLLQITGSTEVLMDDPETQAFVGAERMWRLRPQRVIRRPGGLPLRWVDMDDGISPNALMTGSWEDMQARLKAAVLQNAWRPYRVVQVVDESEHIRSFHLQPDDDAGLPVRLAGQHLPIRVRVAGEQAALVRTYTLSNGPSDTQLRISVKREGVVSTHLHEQLKVGDLVEAKAPAGAFTIDPRVRRSVVMLAAGVGVTPALAMARHLVHEGRRTQYRRPTWLLQAASNKAQLAFQDEFAGLVGASAGTLRHVRLLSDATGAKPGVDFDLEGRMSIELLRQLLPFDDYDFYLCGPQGFMQQMYDGLRDLNIDDARIHAEAFGPSSLTRRKSQATATVELAPVAAESVPVLFMDSAKEARWNPGEGSLLELAEQRGLEPSFGCRGGSCGSCRTRVLKGAVTYAEAPEFEVAEGEALICCAVPAAGVEALHLDL
ncbi:MULTISPECIES: pyridoxamine 5'-phosphate oxidase family protein [unclassified Pseudomonas]|uniref:2Fe-2S iron-sulfur cluster-binding protein n=1 Tax=unclassified Pseudomonas TaxID=196821 RepID=UPI0035C07A93